jgi:hypothetical protein
MEHVGYSTVTVDEFLKRKVNNLPWKLIKSACSEKDIRLNMSVGLAVTRRQSIFLFILRRPLDSLTSLRNLVLSSLSLSCLSILAPNPFNPF